MPFVDYGCWELAIRHEFSLSCVLKAKAQIQNRTGGFDAKIAFKVRDDFTLRKVPVPPTGGTPGGMADRGPPLQGLKKNTQRRGRPCS